ncbi:hypothetical protein [uncultured Algibacter sp.]|uniref:hypothetical protein n=1 Tax=uncultured Algibacter sp. TaxID=298659 RepID=UPI002635AD14|nr:hypothetical protein [uncultured Algibacter sp.]
MIKGFLYKIISLLLITILLANNINTLAIVGSFVVNQDFIAKTLCIQKENQKGCNGKCHLKKQLAKNNSDTSSEFPTQENKRTSLDTFYLVSYNAFNTRLNTFILPQTIIPHNSSRIIKTSFKVETPPPIFS